MQVPTVTILNPNAPSGVSNINESDFDPKRHTRATDAATDETADLDAMTVAELREYAREHGISLGGATSKADIRDAIEDNG